MKIKIAENYEKKDIKKLWADAFSEQEPFLSWYFDNFWHAENSLCVKTDDDSLAGALTLIPYKLFNRGKTINSSYIAGVSVPQHMRMRGISKKLMHAAIKMQAERNESLSLLIPFNYDFYRKMGYKDCGGFIIDVPGYEQPMELFLIKSI